MTIAGAERCVRQIAEEETPKELLQVGRGGCVREG